MHYFYILVIGSYRSLTVSHKNTWVCKCALFHHCRWVLTWSIHLNLLVRPEERHKLYSYALNVTHCVLMSTAKASNHKKQQQKERKLSIKEKCQLIQRSEWNHGSSLLRQLLVPAHRSQHRPDHAGLPLLSRVPFVCTHKAQNNRAVDRPR